MPADIADPRVFPEGVDAAHAPLIELAQASLAAQTATRAEQIGRALTTALVERLRSGEALLLAEVVAAAPSPAIARALWRSLIDAWAHATRDGASGVAATLFALPVIIVAGREGGRGDDVEAAPALPGVLSDTARLAAIMREHRALAGNETFGFSVALVASDEIDVPKLPDLLAWQRLAVDAGAVERDLPPTPIAVQSGQQGVHLRFLIGTALAAPGADLLSASDVAGWAMPVGRSTSSNRFAESVSTSPPKRSFGSWARSAW